VEALLFASGLGQEAKTGPAGYASAEALIYSNKCKYIEMCCGVSEQTPCLEVVKLLKNLPFTGDKKQWGH
jgi:hypothetical protein